MKFSKKESSTESTCHKISDFCICSAIKQQYSTNFQDFKEPVICIPPPPLSPEPPFCCLFLPGAHESFPHIFCSLHSLTPSFSPLLSPFFFFCQQFPALTSFSFFPPSAWSSISQPSIFSLFSVLQPFSIWITIISSLHSILMPTEKAPQVQNRLSLHAHFWDMPLKEPAISQNSNQRRKPTQTPQPHTRAGSAAPWTPAKSGQACKPRGSEAKLALFSKLSSQGSIPKPHVWHLPKLNVFDKNSLNWDRFSHTTRVPFMLLLELLT